TLIPYAALQEIQADYTRALSRSPDVPAKALERKRTRLLEFAGVFAGSPDGPKAILEAGQISETLGKVEDARRCYRCLEEDFAGQPAARKAAGALWRLGRGSEPITLALQ